jgi:hypothetical protein
VAAIALAVALPSPATAEEPLYDGSKARVFLSSDLRTMAEWATASACRAGLYAEAEAGKLSTLAATFDTVVSGLRDGDPTLGIPSAEANARNLRLIAAVEENWTPVRAAFTDLSQAGDDGAVKAVAAGHDELLESAEQLLSELSGFYSNPQELLQVDAVALNFLSRQKMLLGRMDRIVCGLHAGISELGSVEALRDTVELFDLSLVALRDGFPAAGIAPPRSGPVLDALVKEYALWQETRPLIDAVLDAGTAEAQQLDAISARLAVLDTDMRNVITLYMLSSPGQSDVYRVPLQAYVESELVPMMEDPALIAAIRSQNAAHAELKPEDIEALDLRWRAEAQASGGPLVDDLMARPVSQWLAQRQRGSAGFITEAFVMDDKGLNVAQSAVTSDYWQGDEEKWQLTYAHKDGGLHISDVEFDESTGFFQTQASFPIVDPASGEKIGAVTFGINVQRLM